MQKTSIFGWIVLLISDWNISLNKNAVKKSCFNNKVLTKVRSLLVQDKMIRRFKPGQWCSRSRHRPICDQIYAPSARSPVWKYECNFPHCWMIISFLLVMNISHLSAKVVWFTILPVGPVGNLFSKDLFRIYFIMFSSKIILNCRYMDLIAVLLLPCGSPAISSGHLSGENMYCF